MEALEIFFAGLSNFLWGPPLLILLLGTHLFLTFRLGFPQRKIGTAIRLSISRDKSSKGDISQFGALSTALAATIGTGNIVGVATAVALGGPGAVFWCWITGVFGIATKYSEALLAVKYRVRTKDGTMLGGPMYALERGLNMKWLAVLFCIFTSFAAFGIGNTTQANSISALMKETFDVSPSITGIVLSVLTALVMLGGVRSIASVCKILVPFMAVFYIIGCLIILCINVEYLGEAIRLIFKSAFSAKAAAGGWTGATVLMAMRYGVARGLFSNESGLGSAPIVAAAAQTLNPVRQALVSATGTFWDTVVICALTGLVLVSSIVASPEIDYSQGALLTKAAFGLVSGWGPVVLTVSLLTFVFSTLIGWSYYGEKSMEYLFGKKIILPYRVVWVFVVYAGSVLNLSLVWNMSDCMNALMAVPNLIALILLSGVVAKETKKYLWENRLDDEDSEGVPEIRN